MPEMTVEKTKNYLVVKIPLKAVEEGRAKISPRAQKVVDAAINEGLRDIKAGKVFGPFENVKEFKSALKRKK
jgi:predicted transcriptional regulator